MNKLFVTFLENPMQGSNYNKYDGYGHRYIIHHNQWHFGRFSTFEELQKFLDFAGLSLELVEERQTGKEGMFRLWDIPNCKLDDHFYFGRVEDLPEEAKKNPFLGLSNGSTVTCYLWNDGETLHIYRPNPNAKDVYNPLPLEQDVEHRKKFYV